MSYLTFQHVEPRCARFGGIHGCYRMGLPEPGAVLCGCGPKTHLKAEELQLQCGKSVADCVERRRCARPVVGLGEDREHQWPPGAYRSEQNMKVRPWTARSSSQGPLESRSMRSRLSGRAQRAERAIRYVLRRLDHLNPINTCILSDPIWRSSSSRSALATTSRWIHDGCEL